MRSSKLRHFHFRFLNCQMIDFCPSYFGIFKSCNCWNGLKGYCKFSIIILFLPSFLEILSVYPDIIKHYFKDVHNMFKNDEFSPKLEWNYVYFWIFIYSPFVYWCDLTKLLLERWQKYKVTSMTRSSKYEGDILFLLFSTRLGRKEPI